MTDYSQHKRDEDCWFSPPFYTGLRGYKMYLEVITNGFGRGAGTHVSVSVHLMRGEHDDQLKWPFQGDVTIQLLNQRRDEEHLKSTIVFGETAVKYGAAARVTSGERNTKKCGSFQFISHDTTESTTGTTQYLRNDCLKWRVTNIVIRSV